LFISSGNDGSQWKDGLERIVRQGRDALSISRRGVCQVYQHPLPNFRTIRDREALLKPKTLQLIQAKVVQLGRAVGVTTGTRLRVDSSVTESDIHYSTDSSLLNDAARVESADASSARGA
jgi:hypothetical protein